MADYIEQTITSGVRPIELRYHPVVDSLGQMFALRSEVRINSVDMGVLLPAQYRVVSNRNTQCVRLAKWSFAQVFSEITTLLEKGRELQWVSVYVPPRMLSGNILKTALTAAAEKAGFTRFDLLRLELTADIFFEDTQPIRMVMQDVATLGVSFLLSEFGSEFCPVKRLRGLPFQSIAFDASITDELLSENLSVKPFVEYVDELGMQAIADEVDIRRASNGPLSTLFSAYISHRTFNLNGVLRQ